MLFNWMQIGNLLELMNLELELQLQENRTVFQVLNTASIQSGPVLIIIYEFFNVFVILGCCVAVTAKSTPRTVLLCKCCTCCIM